MIIFIDEDKPTLRPFLVEMQFRGYTVQQIEDADAGFETLEKLQPSQIDAVILDVMLPGRRENTKFGRKLTDNYLETGVVFLERLRDLGMPQILSKVVLFTMASPGTPVSRRIETYRKNHAVPVLRKDEWSNPSKFADYIVDFIHGTQHSELDKEVRS